MRLHGRTACIGGGFGSSDLPGTRVVAIDARAEPERRCEFTDNETSLVADNALGETIDEDAPKPPSR